MKNLNSSVNESETVYGQDLPSIYNVSMEDANWIMTSAFIIFTMQTGFGMLESGCVSQKNEVNIMMKNVADIFIGGLSYWAVGFGLSYGRDWTCPFFALGEFILDTDGDLPSGPKFTAFLFQLSFATTATTIVSGAMAERCCFPAYCLFSFLNTVVYCVPAGWVWGDHGFLKHLGCVDIAGSGPVHLIGGSSALASAMMLGPRLGRYTQGKETMGTPVNCAMGLFVLWWGWLAFNSGSTYGILNNKWEYAAKAAVMTMLSSFGGGSVGLIYTLIVNKGKTNIMDLINSVLGSLVSVTAGCFLYTAWDAMIIGAVGGFLTSVTQPFFDYIKIDDPVGAASVHGVSGFWGVIAVGLFARSPVYLNTTSGRHGLFKGGGWYLLGVQSLACVCLSTYSFIVTTILLWSINKITPIRMSVHDELIGADLIEHMIRHRGVGVSRAVSVIAEEDNVSFDFSGARTVGINTGHEIFLAGYSNTNKDKKKNKVKSKTDKINFMLKEKIRFSDSPKKMMAWID